MEFDKDLKNLSPEELEELMKGTVEFSDKELIAGQDWSVACGCMASPWHYMSPVK